MRKITLLLLVVMLCISLCSCETLLQKAKSAITGEEISQRPDDYVTTIENEEYVYELYKTYVKLIEYVGEATEVVLPTELDDKPVTVIGSLCFFETGVTSVTIPKSIKIIEPSAFYYADSLTSIDIPDTVESIGVRAFGWCNALESVKLGNGISEIPDYCFNHCESLVTLDIPQNVKTVGIRAFSYCKKLVEMTIPKSVENLGERSFAECSELQFVTFENENIAIGNNAFDLCEKVAIIANTNTKAYDYCVNNNLMWSTSKTIQPIKLGNENNSSVEDGLDSSNDVSE